MVGTQTSGLDRNIDVATRFLDRIATLPPAERERIGTDSVGSSHTSAIFATADEVTTIRNKDKDGRVSSFLVDVERRVDAMGLKPEVGNLVKAAARAILVQDRPGMDRATRQLYSPFEAVIPLKSVAD